MHIQYIALDRARLPKNLGLSSRYELTTICSKGDPRLAAYEKICCRLVPNVDHQELIYDLKGCGTANVVLTRKGHVCGGATFRLIHANMVEGGASLFVDILLAAVRERVQRKGYGSLVINYLKQLALRHASGLNVINVRLLVQVLFGYLCAWTECGTVALTITVYLLQ